MHHLATLLFITGQGSDTAGLFRELENACYSIQQVNGASEALSHVQRTSPDVLLLGPGLSNDELVATLSVLNAAPQGGDIPTLILTEAPSPSLFSTLECFTIDGILAWPTTAEGLRHSLHPLTRLASMRAELARRSSIYGITVPRQLAQEDEAPMILMLGDEALRTHLLEALGEQADIVQAPDLFSAQVMIEAQRFDACVMMPEENQQALLDLCLQIRRNPRLFNLPVLYISDQDAPSALTMGASLALKMPLDIPELRFSVTTLVRRQRQRWAVRQAMDTTRTLQAVSPVAPETYNQEFLATYADQFLLSPENKRLFSVVGLLFSGVDAICHEFGSQAEEHLLAQIGQWLTLLVRAEDLVAHIGGAKFCVVLPDTPPEEAAIVMSRIAGVISKTEFAVHDVYRVVTVWPFVQPMDLTACAQAPSLVDAVSEALDRNIAFV